MVQRGALGPDRRNVLSRALPPSRDADAAALADFIRSLTGQDDNDASLYAEALTHGSMGEKADYQRLEFLGDRVLGLAMADWLYAQHKDAPEGQLSQRLNRLVSRETCAEVARALGLGPMIRLGKQARDDGARDSVNILGDVMEALIGAAYIDHGFGVACAMVHRLWKDQAAGQGGGQHPKSQLQEWAAQKRARPPEYALIDRSGPHHALTFTVEVSVGKLGSARGTGSSKQEAEKQAAMAFLEQFAG